MMFSRVLLPEPDGPTIAIVSAGEISKLRSERTSICAPFDTESNRLDTFSNRNSACAPVILHLYSNFARTRAISGIKMGSAPDSALNPKANGRGRY